MDTKPLTVAQLGLLPDIFAGQVAVITGAGRGIGREMARDFARLGARVVVAELAESTGQETERMICSEGGQAIFIQTDVASVDSVAELARRTGEGFGPADILINNAILCPVAPVVDMDVALWDRVISVNLRGTFLTCKAFLPEMLIRHRGTILNLISTDAMPFISAYIATKQGIAAFTQSLAAEVAEKGVKVIAFGPGFVDTPGLRSAAEGLAPRMGLSPDQFMKLPIHPAYEGRSMPPEDAAAAAVYLAAKLAGEYHGEQVTGYTILERAGLITDAGTVVETPAATPPPPIPDTVANAAELARRLQSVLVDTEATFGKFPIFVRPMARQGFKSKAGQSLQDWKSTAERLAAQLEAAGSGDTSAVANIHAQARRMVGLFNRLETYYREEPAEMARFTKDAEALRQAQLIAAERTGVIKALASSLKGISPRQPDMEK